MDNQKPQGFSVLTPDSAQNVCDSMLVLRTRKTKAKASVMQCVNPVSRPKTPNAV